MLSQRGTEYVLLWARGLELSLWSFSDVGVSFGHGAEQLHLVPVLMFLLSLSRTNAYIELNNQLISY